MTRPVHVHETVRLEREPAAVCRELREHGRDLVLLATAEALEAGLPLRETAGFRSHRLPIVTSRRPEGEEIGCLVVTWDADEEATGWPSLSLWIVPRPSSDGATLLTLLSSCHPGVDLSTNRVDKVWRDRLARTAVRSFATALARLLATTGSDQGRRSLASTAAIR